MHFKDIKTQIFKMGAPKHINDIKIQHEIAKHIIDIKRHKHVRRIDMNDIKIETSTFSMLRNDF